MSFAFSSVLVRVVTCTGHDKERGRRREVLRAALCTEQPLVEGGGTCTALHSVAMSSITTGLASSPLPLHLASAGRLRWTPTRYVVGWRWLVS